MIAHNFDFVFSTENGTLLVPNRIFYKKEKNELIVIGQLYQGPLLEGDVLNFKNSSVALKQIQIEGYNVQMANPGEAVGVQLDADPSLLKAQGVKI